MSLAKIMSRKLSPFGLKVKVTEIYEKLPPVYGYDIEIHDSEYKMFKLDFSGPTHKGKRAKCNLNIMLPKFSSNGVYTLEGVHRAISMKAFIDYTQDIGKPRSFLFNGKVEVLMTALNRCLVRALHDFYYTGHKPFPDAAQHLIDSWLRTSRYCQYIPDNEIALKSTPELVTFTPAIDQSLDIASLQFDKSLLGVVDYNATSSSKNINRVYRVVKGTKISMHKLTNDTDNMFCSAIEDNGIGLQYNFKRLFLLRTQFEQSIKLKYDEEPLVKPKANMLSGKHLECAIMHYKEKNFEDAICFSESAAKKLTCIRKYQVSITTSNSAKILVQENDVITNETPLISHIDKISGKTFTEFCHKLRGHGVVKSIKAYASFHYNLPAIRYNVTIETEYQLCPGDKVTTRGAMKGVAHIVPDSQMPVKQDGTIIDCIIAPESVVNRQSIVTYWEMMANQYAKDKKSPVISKPFKEEITFEQLVNLGYGKKQQLYIKDKPLKEKTFVGPIFTLRLDKIAHEQVSFKHGQQRCNEQGFPIDKARDSGQRRDLSMTINMKNKGLINTLTFYVNDALSIRHKIHELIRAIRHDHVQTSCGDAESTEAPS